MVRIIIKKLSSFQPIGQPIRSDGPENHIIEKAGTPTMGGILGVGIGGVYVFVLKSQIILRI